MQQSCIIARNEPEAVMARECRGDTGRYTINAAHFGEPA
jgi:hypothetical protein